MITQGHRELLAGFVPLPQNAVRLDDITLHLIRIGHTDAGRFGHRLMTHQGAFNFGRAQPVARHLNHIVNTADYPNVAILIFFGAVARQVPTLVGKTRPILRYIPVRVLEDGAQHAWPGAFYHQIPFFIGRNGITFFIDHINLHTGEGACSRTGLQRHAGQRRNHVTACFCLPPRVHNRAALLADDAVIPFPRLWINRLTYGTKQAQAGKIMLIGPAFAKAHQTANGGRCRVQNSDVVFGYQRPPAIWIWMRWRTFIHEAGCPQNQRRVNNVAVASNPARVRRTPPNVLRPNVKNPL